ncbi:hypothetical protein [Modicisalibacter luteus]|uniref:hypothetical protein n=1 Tax=Modicisalibacter luteus TaxID=453962 RepID=UPI0036344D58
MRLALIRLAASWPTTSAQWATVTPKVIGSACCTKTRYHGLIVVLYQADGRLPAALQLTG